MKIRYTIMLLACIYLHASNMFANTSYLGNVDFVEINNYGDTIYYLFSDEYYFDNTQTTVIIGEMANEINPFKTDSLVIPETVLHNGVEFTVVGMTNRAFPYSPSHVKSISLPKTFVDLELEKSTVTGFTRSSFQSIYCHEDNPEYTSIDGILYSKDKKTLVAYPPQRKDSSVMINEGIEHLGKNAFCCTHVIKTLILPNSLKTIGDRAFFEMSSLKELTLQDSVHILGKAVFSRTPITKLIIGSQMEEVYCSIFNGGSMSRENDSITVICHTLVPPMVNCSSHTTFVDNSAIHLYVPRKSLYLYRQAEGWKDCASILPIEPPIVTGTDTASICWVQNFSATGYVWTLYTDEAKTQRFMSLTFDANGYLTHIDLKSGHMPERMPALYSEDGEEEKRFAEYYTFTISGLSPDTKYYYTRQSLKGSEVIDEETGSFQTLNNEMTDVDIMTQKGMNNTKFLRNNQVIIQCGETTYIPNGVRVK